MRPLQWNRTLHGMDQCSTTCTEAAQCCFEPSTRKAYRTTAHHALHHLCLVSESTFIFFFRFNTHITSPQSYILFTTKNSIWKDRSYLPGLLHTYKTHTMATHHEGSGQPSDRDITAHKTTDTEIEHAQEFHHVNTNDLEESEPNNPTRLTTITRELDDLCQCNQAGEG